MKLNRWNVGVVALCVVALACVAGCNAKSSSRAGLVKASGVVNYNGAAVENAILEFRPTGDSPSDAMAVARTDAQGKFTLMTDAPGDGALPGKYKVVAKKQEQMIDGMTRAEWEAQNAPADKKSESRIDKDKLVTENLLPVKYLDAEKTPLEIEIPAKGDKNIAINLED